MLLRDAEWVAGHVPGGRSKQLGPPSVGRWVQLSNVPELADKCALLSEEQCGDSQEPVDSIPVTLIWIAKCASSTLYNFIVCNQQFLSVPSSGEFWSYTRNNITKRPVLLVAFGQKCNMLEERCVCNAFCVYISSCHNVPIKLKTTVNLN
jgi:hypothetical protein